MKKTFRIFTKIYNDDDKFSIVSREKLYNTIMKKKSYCINVNALTERGWENIEKSYGKTISSPDAIKDIIKLKMSQYSKDTISDCIDIEVIA